MSLHVYIFCEKSLGYCSSIKCIATLIIIEFRKRYFFSFDKDVTVLIFFLKIMNEIYNCWKYVIFKKEKTVIFFVCSPDLKLIPLNIDHSFEVHVRPTCSTCV